MGLGLLIVYVSRSHSDIYVHHRQDFSGRVIRPIQRPLLTQHEINTCDTHPCTRRDSNPQCQQASCRRPTSYTARPLGSALCNGNLMVNAYLLPYVQLVGTKCKIMSTARNMYDSKLCNNTLARGSPRHVNTCQIF